jgi:hypothetical protein
MPPRWAIIVIVLVLIAGCLLAVGVSGALVNVIGDPEQAGMKAGMGLSGFEMPGESTRWGFEPGEYRIFYAYRTSLPAFGNAPYTLPATPPEITCTVTDDASGETIPLREPGSYSSYHSASTDATAIAAFMIPRRRLYRIECAYADGASGPSVILYQGQITPVTRIATLLAVVLPLLTGLCPLGLAVGFAGVLYRRWLVQRTGP